MYVCMYLCAVQRLFVKLTAINVSCADQYMLVCMYVCITERAVRSHDASLIVVCNTHKHTHTHIRHACNECMHVLLSKLCAAMITVCNTHKHTHTNTLCMQSMYACIIEQAVRSHDHCM